MTYRNPNSLLNNHRALPDLDLPLDQVQATTAYQGSSLILVIEVQIKMALPR